MSFSLALTALSLLSSLAAPLSHLLSLYLHTYLSLSLPRSISLYYTPLSFPIYPLISLCLPISLSRSLSPAPYIYLLRACASVYHPLSHSRPGRRSYPLIIGVDLVFLPTAATAIAHAGSLVVTAAAALAVLQPLDSLLTPAKQRDDQDRKGVSLCSAQKRGRMCRTRPREIWLLVSLAVCGLLLLSALHARQGASLFECTPTAVRT